MSDENFLPIPVPGNDDQPDKSELTANKNTKNDPALNIIRNRIDHLYEKEPDAKEEVKEISQTGVHSKHQAYMNQLQKSGASFAQIQTEWHKYYQSLSNEEKHQVWREFYQNHAAATKAVKPPKKAKKELKPLTTKPVHTAPKDDHSKKMLIKQSEPIYSNVEVENVQHKVADTARTRAKLTPKHHFQSLLFGASVGLVVLLIFMFGFFNERFIAPFITPSKTASASPIIIDPNSTGQVDADPMLIIPKLNVEVPVVYTVTSNEESEIQKGLEDGVVHYPTTPVPGEKGNVSIVGHSSNNIFNPGKYKYVFTLLHKMEEGDTFFINYNSQRYVYKVYKKHVVKPSDVWVLAPQSEKESTATLITCDPPGTNVNRLVLVGEQISPEPLKNVAGASSTTQPQPAVVPGNSRSLFSRLFGGD